MDELTFDHALQQHATIFHLNDINAHSLPCLAWIRVFEHCDVPMQSQRLLVNCCYPPVTSQVPRLSLVK